MIPTTRLEGQRKLRNNQNFECYNFTHLSIRMYSNKTLKSSFREAATCPDSETLNQSCEDDSFKLLAKQLAEPKRGLGLQLFILQLMKEEDILPPKNATVQNALGIFQSCFLFQGKREDMLKNLAIVKKL